MVSVKRAIPIATVLACITIALVAAFLLWQVRQDALEHGYSQLIAIRQAQFNDIQSRQMRIEYTKSGGTVSPDEIANILTRREGRGKTGESYLICLVPQRRLCTPSRFLDDRGEETAPSILLDELEAVNQAIITGAGERQVIDYRGVPVLSAYRKLFLPGLNAVLLVEIDVDEVLAFYYRLRNEALVVLAVSWVLIGLLGTAVYRVFVRAEAAAADATIRAAMVEGSGEGIALVDSQGFVTVANSAMGRLLGLEHVVGACVDEISGVAGHGSIREGYQAAPVVRSMRDALPFQNKYLDISLSPMGDSTIVRVTDVTELVKKKLELEQAIAIVAESL